MVSTLGSMSYVFHSGYGYSTRLCKSVASWFINKYYPRHKITLDIIHRGMKREGCLGYCDTTGGWFRPRNFEIEIDTHLDKETYTKTLLHEMFHMKQFIDGTLKTKWFFLSKANRINSGAFNSICGKKLFDGQSAFFA